MILNQLFNEGSNWHTDPEQQQMDATRQGRLGREREPAGGEAIDSRIRADNNARQEYAETGRFWLKQKDTQQHINDQPYTGKAAANAAALELLKQQPELRGNLVITAYGPGEQQVSEGKVKELDQDLKDKSMTEQAFKNKYGKTRTEVRAEMKKSGSSQKLSEAGEWKAEADDFVEWSNHVKDTLLGVDTSQRFSMAKKLSQIEMKHFGAGQAATSFNNQTGASTGNASGMTTTVQHILDAINDGKLTKASSPDAAAAVASAGTTQQTSFGSVTRPADQPDPYQASPALAGGDRRAALAAQNQARPQRGGGSIKILRTEQDWEEALNDPDRNRDLGSDGPTTAAGFGAAMSKLPSWKVMLATIMLASKLPIIGDKVKNTIISSIKNEFGVEMSFKEALGYMEHVRTTPPEEIVSPAVWKFEKDGGDYETAIEQLPDDEVNVRPAEVMAAISNNLISAGVAQEITPGEETSDNASDGAGAFGSMASQLTKKNEPVAEAKGLHKRVRIVKGPDAGKTGWIRQVEHGQYKGAPKKYDVDIEGGGQANGLPAAALRLIKDEQSVVEGVAETVSMDEAKKVLRQYGADHFKTTSNELHFYKNGQPFSVDLIWNDDSTRSVSLSQLNSATRRLKGQGVAEGRNDRGFFNNIEQWHEAKSEIEHDDQWEIPKYIVVKNNGKTVAKWSKADNYGWVDSSGINEASGAETLGHNQSTVASNMNSLDLGEGEKIGNMDADKFDDAMARLKQLAGAGPMRTVYDPAKRVYKNVPTAQQPSNKK